MKMNNRRRKKHYTDHKLQGSLLAAFLTLETLFLGAGIIYLYFRFNQIVEAQLFKIHAANNGHVLAEMLNELGAVVVFLLIANVIALGIAHFAWNYYVRKILHRFNNTLETIQQLDLSPQSIASSATHEVLDILEQWRDNEHTRYATVRALCGNLNQQQLQAPDGIQALCDTLSALKVQLNADDIEPA